LSYVRASQVWLACVLCFGCSELPSIEADVCGNGVIDGAETCDGFGRGDASGRPPGELGACQLDCSLRADVRPACPPGFGCDASNLCRAATGKYLPVAETIAGNAFSLAAGDFNGDGRADILSQQPAGILGSTTFRVLYFDQAGKLQRTWSSSASVLSVDVAEVTPDGRADVVFSDGRLGVLLGQADQSLLSQTYPSYFIPDSNVRLLGPLLEHDIAQTLPILIFADAPEGLTLAHPDSSSASLEVFARFAGSMAQLAGEPALGRLFDADPQAPCNDVVIALHGQSELTVFTPCQLSAVSHDVAWWREARVTRVSLQPQAAIDHGPLLADVNGDGHLDLLLGADEKTYVAFSDGHTLSEAKPLLARRDDAAVGDLPMPLAAGDFNGDGKADFIYPTSFLLSQHADDESSLVYRFRGMRVGAAWTEARVADLNANGLADVIGASSGSLDIDFYNGTGSELMNFSVLQTERPPEHLTVGDFDGDLILDLAFAQKAAGQERATVAIAFGNSAGAPSAPRTIAQVSDLRQLGSLPSASSDALGQLYLLFDQEDASGAHGSAVAWFANTGERGLSCLVELTTFAEDGSIQSVPGLALTTGSFIHAGQTDSVLFASDLHDVLLSGPEQGLWLLTDLQSARGRPQSLGFELDPRVLPLRASSSPNELPQPNLQLLAADLDRDGLSELIVLAPDAAGERCFVTTGNVLGDQPPHHLSLQPAIELAEPCSQSSRLAAADVDGDGAQELVLLTGDSPLGRKLLVLWNDGAGGFSPDALSVAANVDDAPVAFSTLPNKDEHAPALFAYVGADGLSLLRPGTEPHSFQREHVAVALAQPTGVLAADIDGDGIADLAVADQGNIRVLRAELTR
jgi:hypothetical protein